MMLQVSQVIFVLLLEYSVAAACKPLPYMQMQMHAFGGGGGWGVHSTHSARPFWPSANEAKTTYALNNHATC